MLFSAATVASFIALTSASPLLRRQGGGSGLPKNATEPSGSVMNETYTIMRAHILDPPVFGRSDELTIFAFPPPHDLSLPIRPSFISFNMRRCDIVPRRTTALRSTVPSLNRFLNTTTKRSTRRTSPTPVLTRSTLPRRRTARTRRWPSLTCPPEVS